MKPLLRLALVAGLFAFVPLALADRPTAFPFSVTFDDVNPCTSAIHTATISGTNLVHFHGDRFIVHSKRVITTSPTGFVGAGTDQFIDNDHILMFRLSDILTSPSGDRIHARFVQVLDAMTGAVKVETGEVSCLRD